MRPQFRPMLVNPPFGDPGLFVDFLFDRRAFLFDLGDIRGLAPRKILRVSDVFVSHTHMDHFFGFDWLLRICVGRERGMRLFGPPGFLDQVEHKLAAYTWNLVHNYDTDFTLEVSEVFPEGRARRARFRCQARFAREAEEDLQFADGLLLEEAALRIRCAFLDHSITTLAFALEEKQHINIWRNRIEEMGFPVGPWLQELKRAVLSGQPDETPFRVWWKESNSVRETVVPLGNLKREAVRLVPGQKIVYVTDLVYSPQNAERVAALAREADYLFIECVFLHEDADRAAAKYHLTARQAGWIAHAAGAKLVVPFHFSPRYSDREQSLRDELQRAFAGEQ